MLSRTLLTLVAGATLGAAAPATKTSHADEQNQRIEAVQIVISSNNGYDASFVAASSEQSNPYPNGTASYILVPGNAQYTELQFVFNPAAASQPLTGYIMGNLYFNGKNGLQPLQFYKDTAANQNSNVEVAVFGFGNAGTVPLAINKNSSEVVVYDLETLDISKQFYTCIYDIEAPTPGNNEPEVISFVPYGAQPNQQNSEYCLPLNLFLSRPLIIS